MALIEDSVGELPYKLLDMDQHSVEAEDCFTRFMPKDKIDTAVRPITSASGKKVLLANDRIVTALEHDLDRTAVPGSLAEMLRKRASGSTSEGTLLPGDPAGVPGQGSPSRPAGRAADRALDHVPGRLGAVRLGVPEGRGLYDNLVSFNRWIDEDWGFNTKDRIYAPALLSLDNLDRALPELDRVLAAGARFIMLPPGPVGGRSPGDPYFDPFWSRVNESKAIVAYHITEYHYQENVAPHWGWGLVPPFQMSAWQWQNTYGERPITDTLSALIFDNLFGRFPNIKVLVSEYGSEWVPHFIKHMDKSRGMGRNGPWLGGQLPERPSKIFRRHVSVVPYPEDDIVGIADRLGGVDGLVMGSDWPHAEGLREPADFYARSEGLGEQARRRFLRENSLELLSAM